MERFLTMDSCFFPECRMRNAFASRPVEKTKDFLRHSVSSTSLNSSNWQRSVYVQQCKGVPSKIDGITRGHSEHQLTQR